MNLLLLIIATTALLLATLSLLRPRLAAGRAAGTMLLANLSEGVHEEFITRFPDNAVATRYLIAKAGSDAGHADICTHTDIPLGIFYDESPGGTDLTDPLAIGLLGAADETRKVAVNSSVAVGDWLVPDDNGFAKTLPGTAGAYNVIGRCLKAGDATNNPIVEFDPQPHVRFVSAAFNATGTEATDIAALKAILQAAGIIT
jgi:hypothetical protein